MFIINDVATPSNFTITDSHSDDVKLVQEDFDFLDPSSCRLTKAEAKFYKGKDNVHIITHHDGVDMWAHNHLELDHLHISADRFFVGHSYKAYRCNFKGDALKQLKHYAGYIPSAQVLSQMRPRFTIKLELFARGRSNKMFEMLSLDLNFVNSNKYSQSVNELNKKISNLDWNEAANVVEQKKSEWLALSLHGQRLWKVNQILGWSTYYRYDVALT
mgnify:FL=1